MSGVQLHPGDWIIEVNGVKGSAEQLIEKLEKKELLKIRVQQSGRVSAATDVRVMENVTRQRLTAQTKPRQLELLRRYGASMMASASSEGPSAGEPARLMCVCGGALEHLDLRSRVHRLVEPQGEEES